MEILYTLARNIRIKYPEMESDMFVGLLWVILDSFGVDTATGFLIIKELVKHSEI